MKSYVSSVFPSGTNGIPGSNDPCFETDRNTQFLNDAIGSTSFGNNENIKTPGPSSTNTNTNINEIGSLKGKSRPRGPSISSSGYLESRNTFSCNSQNIPVRDSQMTSTSHLNSSSERFVNLSPTCDVSDSSYSQSSFSLYPSEIMSSNNTLPSMFQFSKNSGFDDTEYIDRTLELSAGARPFVPHIVPSINSSVSSVPVTQSTSFQNSGGITNHSLTSPFQSTSPTSALSNSGWGLSSESSTNPGYNGSAPFRSGTTSIAISPPSAIGNNPWNIGVSVGVGVGVGIGLPIPSQSRYGYDDSDRNLGSIYSPKPTIKPSGLDYHPGYNLDNLSFRNTNTDYLLYENDSNAGNYIDSQPDNMPLIERYISQFVDVPDHPISSTLADMSSQIFDKTYNKSY
jgi:hypothetical protein